MPHKEKTVLLYSGGLDSYLTSFIVKPDINLYIDSKSRYATKELLNLPDPPHGQLVVDRTTLDLSAREREDAYVHGRNAFFALIASYHGDRIVFGATQGDRTTELGPPLQSSMDALLAIVWAYKSTRRPTVSLPLKDLTKAELVASYLAAGGDPAPLPSLVSCYDPEETFCARCKCCARKWVALQHNGIDCSRAWARDPRDYFTPELVTRIRNGDWSAGHLEQEQTLAVLEGCGLLPPER